MFSLLTMKRTQRQRSEADRHIQRKFAEIAENGGVEISEAQLQSSRDENLLEASGHDFDARKFSAASVDILIGTFFFEIFDINFPWF